MAIEGRENPAGIEAFLNSAILERAMRERVGEPIKAQATVNTPIDTGRMKASWELVNRGRGKIRVQNTAASPENAPYPWFVEKGTSRMRAQHVLGRAIDAARL